MHTRRILSFLALAALAFTLTGCFGRGSTPYDSSLTRSGVDYSYAWDGEMSVSGSPFLGINTHKFTADNMVAVFNATAGYPGLSVSVKSEEDDDARVQFVAPVTQEQSRLIMEGVDRVRANDKYIKDFSAQFAPLAVNADGSTAIDGSSVRYSFSEDTPREVVESVLQQTMAQPPSSDVFVWWRGATFYSWGTMLKEPVSADEIQCAIAAGMTVADQYRGQYKTMTVLTLGPKNTFDNANYHRVVNVDSDIPEPSDLSLPCGLTAEWR